MASKRRHPRNWNLYLVLDRAFVSDDARLIEIAALACDAGVSAIQLRDKRQEVIDFIRVAKEVSRVCSARGIPFIVNDKPEAALASGADGIHLGPSDISVSLARRLMGKGAVIGVSASTVEGARKAAKEGADYIGAGPVFATPFKKGEKRLNLRLVKKIEGCGVPVILIGGINMRNAGRLVSMGFRRVAVIRAVLGAGDPGEAIRRLKGILTS